MDDLVAEFLTETNEGLEELDQDLVNLEQNPNDKDLLGKIFRLVHTIKGTCGFLGLPRLEKVAHHAENVLGRFRDGDLEVTPEYVTLIFESLDRIKGITQGIEETGSEPQGDDSALIAQLDAVYEGRSLEGAEAAEEATSDDAAEEPEIMEETPEEAEPEASAGEEKAAGNNSGLSEGTVGIVSEAELEAAFMAAEAKSPEELRAELEAKKATQKPEEAKAADKPVEAAKPAAKPAAKVEEKAAAASAPVATQQSLRVNVDVLEDLMTMVSELVLTRNQLLQILRAQTDSEFNTPLQRLNQIVSELQEGVMKTRMQPIGNAWAKLPRIIRDLSIELGKKIDLDMRGQDTELDRQVLDLIKDPLTHMVRNSADHGIEMPEDRKMLGKNETGKILLNAYHEGGHIIIVIADDGKGLAVEKIKQKAISNGLATEEELAGMSDQQIQQFIFKAGFSTAEAVTAVSGRGVGMDVVRTNIEKIGGSIELKSTEGKGSTFTIKIPLTLAIVSALIVESGGERFAIPQLTVRELVMANENAENKIELINGSPVFRLRDNLLPLTFLSKLLKLDGVQDAVDASKEALVDELSLSDGENTKEAGSNVTPLKGKQLQKSQYIVVTQVGSYQFGIIVDKVFDTEEIVVKPVSQILRGLEIFAGNTILGDGSVIMILDPNGIARITGEIESTDAMVSAADDHQYSTDSDKKLSLLLFGTGDKVPKAVPLSLVARLEQVKGSDIEHSSGKMMVQYRGKLMPLIPFDNSVTINPDVEHPVLVFTDKGNSLGLVVSEIIDITESVVDIQHSGSKQGLMGSAIIEGKATDVVDVGHYLRTVDKNWFADHDPNTPYQSEGGNNVVSMDERRGGRRRVLLVDDSPFFRNMLTPLLSMAGYDVTSLESANDALMMCEKGKEFDIIVSDIEMPGMDGFEFAEKVRSESRWQDTPMVALSSHATQQDIERGKKVGFNQYVAKFDRDTLLETLSKTISQNFSEGAAE